MNDIHIKEPTSNNDRAVFFTSLFEMTTRTVIAALFALAAAAAVGMWQMPTRMATQRTAIAAVRTIEWPENEPLSVDALRRVVDAGEPVVLRRTPLLKLWKALSRPWSLKYLAERFVATHGGNVNATLPDIIVSPPLNDTVWRFENSTLMKQYPGTPCWHTIKSVPLAHIVQNIHLHERFGYYYVNILASALGPELHADVLPSAILSPFAPEDTPIDQEQLVWFGSSGVTTQMHVCPSSFFLPSVTHHG